MAILGVCVSPTVYKKWSISFGLSKEGIFRSIIGGNGSSGEALKCEENSGKTQYHCKSHFETKTKKWSMVMDWKQKDND